MTYRTILVHADQSRHAEARIRQAARLARAFDAHLLGAAISGVSPYLLPGSIEMGGQMIADRIDEMRGAALAALDRFDVLAASEGAPSVERRYVDDDLYGGLALQARYADLLVIGQTDPDEVLPGASPELAGYLLMSTGRPVLMLPYAGHVERIGSRAVVAWDGSLEATRAVTCALPLLKKANGVSVLVFDPAASPISHGEEPGADIGLYLARHGVKVEVSAQPGPIDAGNALLSRVADLGADLLVMGGYGHSRFREMFLGGVTRTVLHSMTLPVLLAH